MNITSSTTAYISYATSHLSIYHLNRSTDISMLAVHAGTKEVKSRTYVCSSQDTQLIHQPVVSCEPDAELYIIHSLAVVACGTLIELMLYEIIVHKKGILSGYCCTDWERPAGYYYRRGR